MNQIINFSDRKVLSSDEKEEDKELTADVTELFKETAKELVDTTALEDFVLIAVSAEGHLIIRSSPMHKKDAFWLLTMATDYAKLA